MSIDWSDEALNRAMDAWWRSGRCERRDMRAALDAAVKAQGCPKLPDCKTYADRAYADGRAEALEEAETAARRSINTCREDGENDLRAVRSRVENAIRALKETRG